MKKIFFFIIFLTNQNTYCNEGDTQKNCVVFSLGGMADTPYEEKLSEGIVESRHITRMNYIADQAQKSGCLVFTAHNKKLEQLKKEIEDFKKNNKTIFENPQTKFHFSFSDHGSDGKIPLARGSYVTSDKLFDTIMPTLPKNAHTTFASQICWGSQIAMSEAVKKNPNLCGGSSVDRNNLSYALNNPSYSSKKYSTEQSFQDAKYKKREQEYLGAGWKYCAENPKYRSMHNYHYHGMQEDFNNALRGGSLTSVYFARTVLEDDGKYTPNNPNQLLESYLEYGGINYISKDPTTNTKTCDKIAIDKSFGFIAELEIISKKLQNKLVLPSYFDEAPFLAFKKTYDIAKYNMPDDQFINHLEQAKILYNKGRESLKPLMEKVQNNIFIENKFKEYEKDILNKNLTIETLITKYSDILLPGKIKSHRSGKENLDQQSFHSSMYDKIDSGWKLVQKEIKVHTKAIAYRYRVEEDIRVIKSFMHNNAKNIDKIKTFKDLMKCEQRAMY